MVLLCKRSKTRTKKAYRSTSRNLYYLRRYQEGKPIGFTLRSSLKAKGLIPRSNGTCKVSEKYRRPLR